MVAASLTSCLYSRAQGGPCEAFAPWFSFLYSWSRR